MGWIRSGLVERPEYRRGQAMVIFALIFVVLVGFTALVILAENLLDVTKAHKAGG